MSIDEQKMQENRELRKKRRKKEQMQAFAVLGGAIAVVAILAILIFVGVNAVIKSTSDSDKASKQEASVSQPEQQETDTEIDETETEVAEETQSEEQTESEEETAVNDSEEEGTEEITDEIVVEEITEEQKAQMLDSYVQNILSTMTIEEKVAGMFLVTPQNITGVANALQAGSSTNEAMNTYPVGGLLYDEGNMQDKDQFAQLIYNTKSFSKVELFIAVSDEGGESSPMSLGGLRETVIPGPAQIAIDGGTAGAYSAGINKGSEFRSLGINLNLAPVADVTLAENSVIADRSYGSNVENVLSLTKSEVKGLKDQEVESCLKYFPGHGDVSGDTRTARVVSRRTKEDLQNTEYKIFQEMIAEGIPMIMVSHVSMPEITGDDKPASLSSVIITDILRGELGFQGVVITDYMNKAAVTKYFKYADASVMAVQAGADMIAVPGDFNKSYTGLLKAVRDGVITEQRIDESLMRILRMKYKSLVDYETEMSFYSEEESTGETTQDMNSTQEANDSQNVNDSQDSNETQNANAAE